MTLRRKGGTDGSLPMLSSDAIHYVLYISISDIFCGWTVSETFREPEVFLKHVVLCRQALDDGSLSVVTSGSDMPVIDLSGGLSSELLEATLGVDLIVLEGEFQDSSWDIKQRFAMRTRVRMQTSLHLPNE